MGVFRAVSFPGLGTHLHSPADDPRSVSSKVVLPDALLAHDGSFSDGVTFDDYARYILLTISFGACGVLLLISRRPKHGPTTAREIVIPFARHVFVDGVRPAR